MFGEVVKARDIWIAATMAVVGFTAGYGSYRGIMEAANMDKVPRGAYVLTTNIEKDYIRRDIVEDSYVGRAELAECGQTVRRTERSAAQCEERLSACEADLKSAVQTTSSPPASSSTTPRGETETDTPEGSDLATEAVASSNLPDNDFQSKWFQLKVVVLEVGMKDVSIVVELQPTVEESFDFELNVSNTFLLDSHGKRWYFPSDTAGLFTGVELLPGTSLRSRLRFKGDTASGDLSDPQPPFTFTAIEQNTRERIVIQGIQPQ